MSSPEPPPELASFPPGLPPVLYKQVLALQAWGVQVSDMGFDANGGVVRMITAATPDESFIVHLGGIDQAVAQGIATALLAPAKAAGGLMVPSGKRSDSGIVLP